jgi:hypothetical protein
MNSVDMVGWLDKRRQGSADLDRPKFVCGCRPSLACSPLSQPQFFVGLQVLFRRREVEVSGRRSVRFVQTRSLP